MSEGLKKLLRVHKPTAANDAFLTQVASGNPPDIVGPAGIANLYTYIDAWADLSDYIERDAAELDLDDFDERTLQLYQLPDGQTFSIPLGIYPSILYANHDLFRAAEVPLPPKEFGAPYTTIDGETVPWDYTALADVAELLTQDANGIYADESGFDPANTQVWGTATGGQIFARCACVSAQKRRRCLRTARQLH